MARMEYSGLVNTVANFLNVEHKTVSDYISMLLAMVKGSGVSLQIFLFTLIFSIPLAVFITMGKMSHKKLLSGFVNIILLIVRGTPLMLQLLIVYFAPKFIANGVFGTTINWSSFVAAVVAFSINYACYFAEIYRGGIESIPNGQYEAAKVLGYTRVQTFFSIVLPQVVKRIIPAMGNEVITLVKDTSLVTILSVQELMYIAKSNTNRMVSFTPLLIAGVFYFVMNWLVSWIFYRIEMKMNYYK